MQQHVVVLGGGVIGISTAIALLDHPGSHYNVTLIATDLPSLDTASYTPQSFQAAPSSYASAWAGAHHVSDAKDEKQLKRDKVTFKVLQLLEQKKGFGKDKAALVWVHQTEYWDQKKDYNAKAIEWYPDVSEVNVWLATILSIFLICSETAVQASSFLSITTRSSCRMHIDNV